MKNFLLTVLLMVAAVGVKAQNLVYDANAEVRNVTAFHGVDVGGGISVYISQGSTQALAISADDKSNIPKIKTEVKNGILKIHIDNGFWNSWNWGNKKIKAYITITTLDYLSVGGGSVARLVDEVKVASLEASASGGGIIEGKLTGSKIESHLSGGSIFKLEGSFDEASIDASGGSIFKDYDLSVANCSVDASGGSIINITMTKEMSAEASGGSIINYKGGGVIKSIDASGGSIVRKKDI